MFAPTTIRRNGKQETVPALTAVFMTINDKAARGDLEAAAEQQRFLKYMQRENILHSSRTKSIPPGGLKKQQAFEALQAYADVNAVFVFCALGNELRRAYRAKFGCRGGYTPTAPNFLGLNNGLVHLPRELRRLRRLRNKGAPFDVGFRKTPVSTRFKKGQSGNPLGVRADGFEPLRAGLAEMLPVVAGEMKTVTRTALALSCEQALRKTMNGDPKACRIVRQYLVILDKKNLLRQPEPPPKKIYARLDMRVMALGFPRLQQHMLDRLLMVKHAGPPPSASKMLDYEADPEGAERQEAALQRESRANREHDVASREPPSGSAPGGKDDLETAPAADVPKMARRLLESKESQTGEILAVLRAVVARRRKDAKVEKPASRTQSSRREAKRRNYAQLPPRTDEPA